MKRQASAQVAPTDRGGGGGEEAPDTKKAGGGPLWGGGGGGGAAQRKSRWLRSSTTARDSSAFDEEFGGRIEALDKGLKSGLSAMEERMKASEESLKVRVTQMELAIMGALNKVSSGGARGGGGHPTDEDSFTGGSTTRMNNRRRSEQVMAMTSMSESSAGGGSEVASSSSSGNLDFEMARAGQHVSQMQSLLERDAEIRTALNSIRRQVRGNARTLTRGLGESTDSEEAPYGTPRSNPPTGLVDAWRRCCVIEEGSDRCGGLRRLLRMCGPVLHPDSRLRSIWNASMAVLIVYCGVAIPLEIAFENDMFYSMCATPITVPITGLLRQECVSWQVWYVFNVIVDVWFMVDVVLNLRTGYMAEGHFVNDDLLAIQHYLRGSFLFDVIGSFPLNLALAASNDADVRTDDAARGNKLLRMIRIAKLFKLFRMIKLGRYLEYVEVVIKFNPGMIRVFKLILISIGLCHWFGCLWWLISDLEIQDLAGATGVSYVDQKAHGPIIDPQLGVQNDWHPPHWLKYSEDLGQKYWYSFFWGAGIALSMVPRDVTPMTTIESFFTTAMMFLGLLIVAFVISSFTSAFASMDSKNALAGKQLDIIRNYLLLKSVPNDLRGRILEYYQYIFTSSQSFEDMKWLNHMPLNLSTHLALSINAKIIAKCPFFNEVSNASLAAIISTLTPLVFVPGQLMCSEGQHLRVIYFINRGKVQLLRAAGSDSEVLVRTLSDSDNLGLEDFSGSTARRYTLTARSLTYSDVMSLSTEELSAALEWDAAERLKREAERAAAAAAAAAGGEGKEKLAACLRKAGHIAKMSNLFSKAKAADGGSAASNPTHDAGGGSNAAGGNTSTHAGSALAEGPAPASLDPVTSCDSPTRGGSSPPP